MTTTPKGPQAPSVDIGAQASSLHIGAPAPSVDVGPQASSLQSEPQASSLQTHKGWYSRGYLPHFDDPGLIQGITFRLWDSLPAHVVESLVEELKQTSSATKRARIEAYLNAGYGACYLCDPRIGRLVENALLHFDGERYRMIAWVVMPNHVHTLIETIEGYPLGTVLHSWKSYTASKANQILGRSGRFWYHEYFDRYIRDERHFANAVRYIHENPVKAGLVEKPEEWLFSSARLLED
ncbi:MAG: transposase [Anaerolineae bacterium]|nr:transposase [Anaerolineae bacterium]